MDIKNVGMIGLGLTGTAVILDAADAAGQGLPLTEVHRRLLETAEAAGLGDADDSAIIRAFDRKSSERMGQNDERTKGDTQRCGTSVESRQG